ncbi:alpha-protein kinase 2 isoform 2-T2 [Menidia menidia]
MDVSLLCTDDQRRSAPALTDSQTRDSEDSVCVLLSAHQTVTDSVCDFPVISKISTEEKITDSNSLTPSSSNWPSSQRLSLCSEPPPKDEDLRLCCCSGALEPTLPLLPQLSCSFIPSQSSFAAFCVNQDSSHPFSAGQEMSTPTAPVAEGSGAAGGLIEPFATETFTSCSLDSRHCQPAPLSRSLSPQSDSLDSDSAGAPTSDLYISESDTHDFSPSQTLDPHHIICPECQSFSDKRVGQTKPDYDTCVLVCDSAGIVTRCHHGSSEMPAIEGGVSEVSKHEELRAPAAEAWEVGSMPVNDGRLGKAGVTGLTPQRTDSPVELWLDACQYLTGEDTEGWEIVDRQHQSVMQEGPSTESCSPQGDRKVSDYNRDGGMGIGWSCDDTRGWGPPVERWSSVDSWATALSDWTGILEAPPEDITAAFAEIGAEIDALTQALEEVNTHIESDLLQVDKETAAEEQLRKTMGIQDQPQNTQNIPESSIYSEQSCLSFCLDAPEPEHHDKEGSQGVKSLCDPLTNKQEEQEPEEPQMCQEEHFPLTSAQHSSTDSSNKTVVSLGGQSVDAAPASSVDLDLFHFDGHTESFHDLLMGKKDEPIILNITEDTDSITPSQQPLGDDLTHESGLPQLGSVTTELIDWDPNQTETHLNLLTAYAGTTPDVRGVDAQPDLHVHESFNTLPALDGAHQEAPQFGRPEFIMPLAPLSFGSSLICWTNSSLEGDQTCTKRSLTDSHGCDHIQPCTFCPIPDDKSSKDKQNHKKQSSTNTSEEQSLGQLEQFPTNDTVKCLLAARETEIDDLRGERSKFPFFAADRFIVSEESRLACITLDLDDPFFSGSAEATPTIAVSEKSKQKMPHKTHKHPSESKTRSKKDKSSGHIHTEHTDIKTESTYPQVIQQICKENQANGNSPAETEAKEAKPVIGTVVGTEKGTSKHSKKKKRHGPNTTTKSAGEPSNDVEIGAKPKTAKGRPEMIEVKLGSKTGKAHKEADQSVSTEKKAQQPEEGPPQEEQAHHHKDHKDHKSKCLSSPLKDDVIKRRRVSGDKFGKLVSVLESKLPKAESPLKGKGAHTQADVGVAHKKAYSEVVKQNIPAEDPKVVQPIQAVSVSGDPQSLCLWCQFSAVFSDYTVSWTRDGKVLAEIKRSAGDESRVSLTISNASHKDLGKYQCRLSSLHGSITLDYLLTYEILSEVVIPLSPQTVSSAPVEGCSEEEDVHCSGLLFKEDFLSEQYFGEKHVASIVTEKVHFGEGMHRRAFRTKLQAGQIPLLVQGHSCVLKVHNAISYGTKNDELVQKNFNLAVEECHVQNTAREYIKAYTAAARAIEAFGDVPDIIPIYLVHRPSNDIPYATLEEELIGDFVKYSVKDGKEINLKRRDSEAGQKCCAFQHWVFHNTEGNLLVTDMQGVGMRLTDVGIATCKKGYKGFKGNCATSFIDQFKALHQCNKYCEILGLKSMQPKPKKAAAPPKPKPQPTAAPKKKTFGPTLKGKS